MRTFAVCFAFGGAAYVALELLWRGKSHVSMFLVGGCCFAVLDCIFYRYDPPLLLCGLIGSAVITAMEFLAGYLVNVRMGLKVWDYSALPANLYGQICAPYSLLWYGMGIAIYYAGGALRILNWV